MTVLYALTGVALAASLPITFTTRGTELPSWRFLDVLSVVMPLLGLTTAILNYVVTTTFFAEAGGRTHTGTASTLADIFGVGLSCVCQLVVGQLIEAQQYTEVLVLAGATWTVMGCAFTLSAVLMWRRSAS